MATNAWIVPVTGAWSSSGNWSDGVPTADQDVLIGVNGTYAITASGTTSAESITLNSTGATLDESGTLALGGLLQVQAGTLDLAGVITGGTIETTGGTIVSGSGAGLSGVTTEGTVALSGSTLGISITNGLTLEGAAGAATGEIDVGNGLWLDFAGSQVLSGGSVIIGQAGQTWATGLNATSGTLTLAPNVVIQAAGPNASIQGSVVNQGTILANTIGAGFYTAGINNATLMNQGLVSISNGDQLSISAGSTLANAGTLQLTSGGKLYLSSTLTNTGTIIGTGGTVYITGSGTTTEIQQLLASGAAVSVTSYVDNSGGTITVGTGAGAGTLTLGYGGVIHGGVVQGTSAGLIISGGTLDGITYDGTLAVTGGYQSSPSVTIAEGITLAGSSGIGPGVLDIRGGLLFADAQTIASGTIIAGGTGSSFTQTGFGAGLNVATGSVLTLGPAVVLQQTGTQFEIGGGVVNLGLIEATAGARFIIDPGAMLNNQGTVVVSGGDTLRLAGSIANAGTLRLEAGGTLDFAGGTLSNTGSIALSGGVVELTGTGGSDFQGGGTITAAQFQAAASIGAPILLNGTLDNSGETVVIGTGSSIGTLTLEPLGAIRNGVVVDRGNGLASTNAIWPGTGLLDGVTYEGGLNLGSNQRLSIANGITLTGTAGIGLGFLNIGSSANVTFQYNQTLDNALVQVGGTVVSGGTLTLGSHLTLQANGSSTYLQGTIVSSGSILASGTATTLQVLGLVNTGTVAVNGGAIANMISTANSGSMTVSGGGVLNLSSGVTSTGRITETNATLNLSGPLTLATLNTISRSGGIVSLGFASTLDLAGGTLALGGTTALGQLRDHALIANGTIADSGGGLVFYGIGPGTMRNVTYRGLVNLTPALSSLVVQGLTVTGASGTGAGTVNVLGAGSSLTFQDTQTFDNATINIGSNAKSDTLAVSDSTGAGAALTLGAHASLMQRGVMAEIDIDRDLGGALVNNGLIGAIATNGSLIVLGGTFANAGRIVVANGETMTLEADRVTNLGGNMLGGGYWEVDANSTLNLGMDNPIVTMNAAMVLNGPGSQVQYYDTSQFKTTSLEQSLHYIGTAGVLVLENGRAFNDPGLFFTNGKVTLAGGSLSGQPIAISTTGLIMGSGTVTANAIYDSGHVLAQGGNLIVNAPLLGGNPVGNALVAGDGTLTANAAVTVPVQFLASTGTLALGQPGSMGGLIYGFTGDDAIDLVHVGTTGVSLSYAPGAGQGVLTVKSGTATAASLHFKGSYVTANFRVTTDGHGGTLILDPPVPAAGGGLTLADFGAVPAPPAPGGALGGGTLAAGYAGGVSYDPPQPTQLIGVQS
jgi:fibronectin-binding autotransporter adhesin